MSGSDKGYICTEKNKMYVEVYRSYPHDLQSHPKHESGGRRREERNGLLTQCEVILNKDILRYIYNSAFLA